MRGRTPGGGPGGFTLVELLVVIAIIAVLASILLPSLQSARRQARSAVCQARLHDFGNACGVYTAEQKEWIPGVNTSGLGVEELRYAVTTEAFGRLHEPNAPVQSFDWMTPLIAQTIALPRSRAQKWAILANEFACPAMDLNCPVWSETPIPDRDDFLAHGPYRGVSYLMPVHFQYYGRNWEGVVVGNYVNHPDELEYFVAPRFFEAWHRTFKPRIGEVGQPARKIMAADGNRFREKLPGEDTWDFQIDATPTYFGSFASSGGWWQGSREYGPRWNTTTWDGRPIVADSKAQGCNLPLNYRHGRPASELEGTVQGNAGTINALMFDGHVEQLNDRQSREISLWYPSGAEVIKPDEGMTRVPDDPNFRVP